MEIRMFNLLFGESIFIRDDCDCPFGCKSEGLLVDCGSLVKSEEIDEMYDLIFDKIKSLHPDALITHFHIDHIAGFLKFAKEKGPVFNTLYLPDIFDIKNRDIIFKILLDYILQSTYISNSKSSLSLYDLAMGLCFSSKNITFLKKGDKFRIFKVLAPDIESVKKAASALDYPISEEWYNVIKCFITLIQDRAEGEINRQDERLIYLRELNVNNLIPQSKNENINALNKFGHSVNIIFHTDCEKSDKNILFTGDAEYNVMEKLYNNKEFYDKYIVYKVPHHGTERHLFTKINADKILISNGYSNGHDWNIHTDYCSKYKNLYCTNCNCCDTKDGQPKNYCEKIGNELVFPEDFCKFTF